MIRFIQHDSFPAMLVFYEQGQRKRFIPSGKDIPSSLFSRLRREFLIFPIDDPEVQLIENCRRFMPGKCGLSFVNV